MDKFVALELASRNEESVEGYVNEGQQQFLQETIHKYLSKRGRLNVLNIGFNRGHSAVAFLSACDCDVTSVDIGVHQYIYNASQIVDDLFPGRHRLVVGDSTIIVPTLQFQRPLDLVFIDGGHVRPVPWLDIANCAKLVKNDCLVVVDDYCPAYGSEGVIEAWDRSVKEGLIEPLDTYSSCDRGIVVGRYIQSTNQSLTPT